MVGLIWFVQIVHYPLYSEVGEDRFVAYEQAHNRLTSWVVIPLMLSELVTAALLVAVHPPPIASSTAWLGLGLVLAIWLVTFTIQVPQHGRLCLGFDASTAANLVRGNWLRTILWSLRGGLVVWMLSGCLMSENL